jgi:phosphoadenosine phosphosulfate reductase
MLVELVKKPRVFTIDTGRNFPETYEVWDAAIKKYQIPIETYYPRSKDIYELNTSAGPNLFYESVENRKKCCHVRKVIPLSDALKDAKVWLSGLRRQQGKTRKDIPIIAFNEKYQVYKICPLANWDEEHVWYFIRNNDIPYNKLHDRGFPTIGCAPCTRPVRPAQDIRSGRWWWEQPEQRECGIHIEDGKVVRKPKLNYDI